MSHERVDEEDPGDSVRTDTTRHQVIRKPHQLHPEHTLGKSLKDCILWVNRIASDFCRSTEAGQGKGCIQTASWRACATGRQKTREPPPKRGLSLERRLDRAFNASLPLPGPDSEEDKGPEGPLSPWFFTYGVAKMVPLSPNDEKIWTITSRIVAGGVLSI